VFERFTDRARRVLVLAQEEARLLGDGFIGTEHLLLGLMQERDGVAAAVLEALGISYDAVRESVRDAAEAPGIPQGGSSPFTPRAEKVLELSLREALQLGHPYIGTQHLLLGLLGEGQGVGIYTLTGVGADLGAVRRETIRRMEGRVRAGPAGTVSQFHAGRQVARSREWAPPQWDRPSEGTVPTVLAIDAPVIQSDVVAVTLDHLEVSSNGFSINVLMRVNPHKVRDMWRCSARLAPIGGRTSASGSETVERRFRDSAWTSGQRCRRTNTGSRAGRSSV
jgi:hypothetical protein